MFDTKKTLIVVYKDEMLLNQLKKLVQTNDDSEEGNIVGTKDGSLSIVAWSEKTWLDNKKSGIIKNKVLFLGDIKGVDSLIPVIDVKFEEFGVKYGWAGEQAIVYTDKKALDTRDKYKQFLDKICDLPIPEMIKERNQKRLHTKKSEKAEIVLCENNKECKRENLLKKIVDESLSMIEKAGTTVVDKVDNLFRDKDAVERQMLFYGVFNLYMKDLEKFMNL